MKAQGRVPAVRGGPPALAVGAVTDHRRAAAGFLATSGHYGVHAGSYAAGVGDTHRTVAVLRAVGRGLDHLYGAGEGDIEQRGAAPGAPVEVHLEDLGAAVLLTRWARHGYGLPDAYGPGPFARGLERLGWTVQRNSPAVAVRYCPPHTGAGLNRAADALARLGLRAAKGLVAEGDVPRTARRHAQLGLAAVVVTGV